ncbi:MAG: MotA/TolQ/ExbB proton channel family protein [Lentisphaerales bacterium]|nr:MAG: MotA/TolQ/ExbB proton channel family protein [Lentisphaerales bacterium]
MQFFKGGPYRMKLRTRFLLFVTLMSVCWIAGTVLPEAIAQDAGEEPVAELTETTESEAGAVETSVSFEEVLRISGWPMYVLIFASIVAAAFVIYFFYILRQEHLAPRSLRRELASRLESGSLADARSTCLHRPCALSAIALSALDYLQSEPGMDPALLKDAIQVEGGRQAESLQGRTRYLMDLAAITPMIGLLGTVLGMVKAFRAIAVDEAMARPLVLADGVRQALYTTVAGLLIAIPSMVFYSFFRERAVMLISRLEAASTDLAANLLRRRI